MTLASLYLMAECGHEFEYAGRRAPADVVCPVHGRSPVVSDRFSPATASPIVLIVEEEPADVVPGQEVL